MMFINISNWSVIGLYVVMLLLCTLFQTLQSLYIALETVASPYTASHSVTTAVKIPRQDKVLRCEEEGSL